MRLSIVLVPLVVFFLGGVGLGSCSDRYESVVIKHLEELSIEAELVKFGLNDPELRGPVVQLTQGFHFYKSYPTFFAKLAERSQKIPGTISFEKAIELIDQLLAKGRGGTGEAPWPKNRPNHLKEEIAWVLSTLPHEQRTPDRFASAIEDSLMDRAVDLSVRASEEQAKYYEQLALGASQAAKRYQQETLSPKESGGARGRLEIDVAFESGLEEIKNPVALRQIEKRIEKIREMGPTAITDWKPLHDPRFSEVGLREMRIAIQPGYRVYFKSYGTYVRVFTVSEKPKEGNKEVYTAALKAAGLVREYESNMNRRLPEFSNAN